jgi:hypothetical protein
VSELGPDRVVSAIRQDERQADGVRLGLANIAERQRVGGRLSTPLLARGEAALGTGKGKRGGVLQPGILGWAADRDASSIVILTEQDGLGHARRVACHHDPLPHRMPLIGEL